MQPPGVGQVGHMVIFAEVLFFLRSAKQVPHFSLWVIFLDPNDEIFEFLLYASAAENRGLK